MEQKIHNDATFPSGNLYLFRLLMPSKQSHDFLSSQNRMNYFEYKGIHVLDVATYSFHPRPDWVLPKRDAAE